MNPPPPPGPSRRLLRAWAGLSLLSSAALLAQSGGDGSTTTTGTNAGDGSAATASSGAGTSTGTGSAADTSTGTSTSTGTDTGSTDTSSDTGTSSGVTRTTDAAGRGMENVRRSDLGTGSSTSPSSGTRDSVERGRAQRNLPGAGAEQMGAAGVTQPATGVTETVPGVTDMGAAGAGVTTGAQTGAGERGATAGTDATTAGATARDSRTTARMIGETSFTFRDRAMQLAEGELTEGGTLGSAILRGAESLSGAARARVNDAITSANAARTELAKAISRARSANESRWESSRSEVVERYEAYVKALDEARAAAVQGGVQLPDAAGTSATMPPAPR